MIIVKLKGGLGNQMFQYALGRRLSLQYKTLLKLDLSHLKPNLFNILGITTLRNYALGEFNVRTRLARKEDLPFLSRMPSTRYNIYLNRIAETFNSQSGRVVRELPCSYDQNIKNVFGAGKNVYLDGFWASEKYFKDIAPAIRRDFSLKKKMSFEAKKLARQISRSNSVSIHIRRQDYVTNPNTRRFHGVCGLDYYLSCIRHIARNIPSPYFFVFSDDIDWAKENLKIKYPTVFVDHSGSDAEEIILMSLCKHNIIANSSFSWWGAWLNKNPGKIVVAPKTWFRARLGDKDIVPNKWVRI